MPADMKVIAKSVEDLKPYLQRKVKVFIWKDGTLSFRSNDKNPDFNPAQLKRNYPSALLVFSVDTESDAISLIHLAAPKSRDSDRYGLPAILREDMANMVHVAEFLDLRYALMKRTVTHEQFREMQREQEDAQRERDNAFYEAQRSP